MHSAPLRSGPRHSSPARRRCPAVRGGRTSSSSSSFVGRPPGRSMHRDGPAGSRRERLRRHESTKHRHPTTPSDICISIRRRRHRLTIDSRGDHPMRRTTQLQLLYTRVPSVRRLICISHPGYSTVSERQHCKPCRRTGIIAVTNALVWLADADVDSLDCP